MKRLIAVAATLVAAGCMGSSSRHTAYDDCPRADSRGRHNVCLCSKPTARAYSAPVFPARTYVAPAICPQPASVCPPFVGPRGATGPAGIRGERGPSGATGSSGAIAVGPRGPSGPMGPTGDQGRAGSQGPAGDLRVGPSGVAGPAGDQGEAGGCGPTGSLGVCESGPAGPAGPAGCEGAQGPAGEMGSKGPTLVGPTGPAGNAGPAGARGEAGSVGARGTNTSGIAGPAGAAGPAGPRGPVGPKGAVGPAGVLDCWVSFRDFWFDSDKASIDTSDFSQVSEIASYLKANPSLKVGIDASLNPRSTDSRVLDLNSRRVKAIRDALIQAGVSSDRIVDGQFGDVNLRRDRRVEILLMSK